MGNMLFKCGRTSSVLAFDMKGNPFLLASSTGGDFPLWQDGAARGLPLGHTPRVLGDGPGFSTESRWLFIVGYRKQGEARSHS